MQCGVLGKGCFRGAWLGSEGSVPSCRESFCKVGYCQNSGS